MTTFCATFGKIGLLFNLSSGHSASKAVERVWCFLNSNSKSWKQVFGVSKNEADFYSSAISLCLSPSLSLSYTFLACEYDPSLSEAQELFSLLLHTDAVSIFFLSPLVYYQILLSISKVWDPIQLFVSL